MSAYQITTENSAMDIAAIHAYLSRSYWAKGVPIEVVRRSVENSLCFGVFLEQAQIGFARLVTDKATFGYLADVYILEAHQHRGLGKQLMTAVMAHPDIQGLRRLMLATQDAHGLYGRYGFTELSNPALLMELHRPNIYHE